MPISQKGFAPVIIILATLLLATGIIGGSVALKNSNFLKTSPATQKEGENKVSTNSAKIKKEKLVDCSKKEEVKSDNKIGLLTLVAGTIDQGQRIEKKFDLDEVEFVAFTLQAKDSSKVKVLIYDPAGSEKLYENNSEAALFGTVIKNPTIGAWKIVAEGVNNAEKEPFQFNVAVGSDLAVNLLPYRFKYRTSEEVTLCLYLKDKNQYVEDLKAEGYVVSSANLKRFPINFFDDGNHNDGLIGDGVYGAVVTNRLEEGASDVAVTILGKRIGSKSNFSRIKGTFFTTLHSSYASFEQAFTSKTVDENNDGLFDKLVFSGVVDVKKPGKYRADAILLSNKNEQTGASAYQEFTLKEGKNPIDVVFYGSQISSSKVDGPYEMVYLRLLYTGEETKDFIEDIDYIEKAAVSQKYTYDQFQREMIEIGQPTSDEGVDTDGNGKFNFIKITIPVNVVSPGDYGYTAFLRDKQHRTISTDQIHKENGDAVFLKSGHNDLVIKLPSPYAPSFSVKDKLNGPYTLDEFEMQSYVSDLGNRRRLEKAYETKPYLLSDFDIQTDPPKNLPDANLRDAADNSAECRDSDLNHFDDLYVKGNVIYRDSSGIGKAVYDECNGTGTQVNEQYCYKQQGKSVNGTIVLDCPKGCQSGACIK